MLSEETRTGLAPRKMLWVTGGIVGAFAANLERPDRRVVPSGGDHTANGLVDLRREVVERSVPRRETWLANDTLQIDDPDGNELLFSFPR